MPLLSLVEALVAAGDNECGRIAVQTIHHARPERSGSLRCSRKVPRRPAGRPRSRLLKKSWRFARKRRTPLIGI